MNKDIVVLAHFVSDFDGKGNNRFNYISNIFSENDGFDVELITSSFSHIKKQQRSEINPEDYPFKITMLNEPNYKKNIELKRILSHQIFGRNIEKYLNNRKKPDVIYCCVPSLDVAQRTAKYCLENNVKFVIDIQDLWPEAFKMIINNKFLENTIYKSIESKANDIYENSDAIVSVSQTYLDRALEVNRKSKYNLVTFLGTDLREFDKFSMRSHRTDEFIDLVYAGTLGHSYDIKVALKAYKILQDSGFKNLRFYILGDGPLKAEFEEFSKGLKNVHFLGRLPYFEMVEIMTKCNIAINCIKKGAAQSIINKHGDYAAAGLPVINTQENPEYREIVEKHNIGFNCNNNDEEDMARKLEFLIKNKEVRIEMGNNNRKFAEEKFDRSTTYPKIIDLVEKVIGG